MTPISWLTVSTAAARLHKTVEEIQRLVDAGSLHGRWIHDHLSISEESVEAYSPDADAEDAMAEYLVERAEDLPERTVSVHGGPELDPQTEFEYEREKRT
ncbi:hypothetical protein [Streptosporangium sp. NPDC051022]|uniref:hypothetical protein n=1 Tax=Streptosporangium sp. NPDC051022 TaxID=3155752 RepID=UPI00343D34CC